MIKFFKKTVLLFTLACAFTMLFMPVNVKADNGNDGIVAFDDLNEEDFKEANEALCEIGRNAKRARTVFTVTMTPFYQTDSAWADDIMYSQQETIAQSGCYLTSFAMVANYYFPNAGYNPKTINVLMGNEACPFKAYIAADRTGLSVYNYKEAPMEDSLFTDLVAGAMVMERPVIIGMCKANGDSHYVVARGYSTTTGEIYILDPGSRSTNKLSTYTDAGAAITAVLIYGR